MIIFIFSLILNFLGYVEKTQQILDSSRDLLSKLKKEFDGVIQILGDPTLSVITFTTTPHSKIPVHLLGDELNELGWNLTLQQSPDSLVVYECNFNDDLSFID